MVNTRSRNAVDNIDVLHDDNETILNVEHTEGTQRDAVPSTVITLDTLTNVVNEMLSKFMIDMRAEREEERRAQRVEKESSSVPNPPPNVVTSPPATVRSDTQSGSVLPAMSQSELSNIHIIYIYTNGGNDQNDG
jgi:hypothetical protein